MWQDIIILSEMLIKASIKWTKNLNSFLYALLILYWIIAFLTFVFAIDHYQEIEKNWFRTSFVEAMIWPYAFYKEYNHKFNCKGDIFNE